MRALLVAFKGFRGAKTRLAGLLGTTERAVLAGAMLRDVLSACLEVGLPVFMVTPDKDAAGVGKELGAEILPDPGLGLNSAVDSACQQLEERGFAGVAALAADLPLLSAASVKDALDHLPAPGVLLAPDRRGVGTNLLAREPPLAIPASFGGGSARRHLLSALRSGLPVTLWKAEGLAEDVDSPEDLKRLLRTPPERPEGGHTLKVARSVLRIPEAGPEPPRSAR